MSSRRLLCVGRPPIYFGRPIFYMRQHILYNGAHLLYGVIHLLFGVARSLYRMACTDWLWRTISFTAAGEKQFPTMLSERDTRGGTNRDFSTPLETRIQKETCRESRQVSYTPYGIR